MVMLCVENVRRMGTVTILAIGLRGNNTTELKAIEVCWWASW